MSISTVNALAVSARAYLSRAVSPTQGGPADAAAVLPERRDEAARRRDRAAAPSGATPSTNGCDPRTGHRRADGEGAPRVAGATESKGTHAAAATRNAMKAASSRDKADEPEDDDGAGLDTGALVARFFDVLHAAAQAGSAAGRSGGPLQAGESDNGDASDAAAESDPVLGSTAAAASPGGSASPLDGPAMSMPWARSWAANEVSGTDGAGATAAWPAAPGSSTGRDGFASIADRSGVGDASTATEGESISGHHGEAPSPSSLASARIGGGVTGAWPLFGPPAINPSARSPGESVGGGPDLSSIDTTSAVASSKARLEASLLPNDPAGSAPDRVRPSTAAPGDSATTATPVATPSGTVSALWPWPSASTGSSTSTVALPAGSPGEWREALSHALGERLQLTLKQGGDQAVIRLDPPQLGRIDLSIRQEGAALSVHLSASNPDVLRQLQAMGDGLRQDLATRHAGDLTVTVAHQPSGSATDADARQRDTRRDEDTAPSAPGRALAEADGDAADEPDPRDARCRGSFAAFARSGGAA